MSDVEHHRRAVDEIERLMLAEPETIPVLRTQREAALEELREAEAAEDERHHRDVRDAAHEAIRSLRGDVPSDWTAKHRRWHSAAVKSRLVGMLGGKAYLRMFPW